MKQLVLLLLTFFGYSTANSQCDFEVNKVDEFTKQRIMLTEKVKIVNPTGKYPVVLMALGRVDTSKSVVITMYHKVSICCNSDSKLLLLMDDESIFDLPTDSDRVDCSSVEIVMGMTLYKITRAFSVTQAQLTLLGQKGLSRLRLESSSGLVDAVVDKKNVNKGKGVNFFKNWAHCVSSIKQ